MFLWLMMLLLLPLRLRLLLVCAVGGRVWYVRMYVRICVHLRTCAYVCVCMYRTSECGCACKCMCVCVHGRKGESQYILACVCICVYVCTRVVVSMYVHSMYPRKYLGMCACLRDNDGDCVHTGKGRHVGPPEHANDNQDLQKSRLSSSSAPSSREA